MSTFKFRLQKVLDLKQHKERQVAAHLAEARRDAEAAGRAQAEIAAAHASGMESMLRAQTSGGLAGELQRLALVIQQISEHLDVADEASRLAQDRAGDATTAFSAAFQERRILEQLRERYREAWRTGQEAIDRKLMDEIASLIRAAEAATGGERA